MGRIPGVPESKARGLVRWLFWQSRRMFGKVPEPTAVMPHQPRLLLANGIFELGLSSLKRVPAAVKKLAEVRVATLIGCPF